MLVLLAIFGQWWRKSSLTKADGFLKMSQVDAQLSPRWACKLCCPQVCRITNHQLLTLEVKREEKVAVEPRWHFRLYLEKQKYIGFGNTTKNKMFGDKSWLFVKRFLPSPRTRLRAENTCQEKKIKKKGLHDFTDRQLLHLKSYK